MIKKIALTLVLCCILISCGKKGDPEYKVSKIQSKMKLLLIKKG